MKIPNREILGIYEDKIRSRFRLKVTSSTSQWRNFCSAIKNGDAPETESIFNKFLADSISIRDTYAKKEMKENLPTGKAITKDSKRQNPSACFYHGMLLGLLKTEGSWIAKSNVESGIGYTDIEILVPSEKIGCIIEVKYAENGSFDTACHEAMEQIENKSYVSALQQAGMETIYKFGVACYRKGCKVVYGRA